VLGFAVPTSAKAHSEPFGSLDSDYLGWVERHLQPSRAFRVLGGRTRCRIFPELPLLILANTEGIALGALERNTVSVFYCACSILIAFHWCTGRALDRMLPTSHATLTPPRLHFKLRDHWFGTARLRLFCCAGELGRRRGWRGKAQLASCPLVHLEPVPCPVCPPLGRIAVCTPGRLPDRPARRFALKPPPVMT
jgi:hypothetical protein